MANIRFTPEQIDRLAINATEGSDGHTEYAFDREDRAGRYVVGGAGEVLTLSSEALLYEPVRSRGIIRRWTAGVASNAETLGFWEDDGLVYFDAGDTYTDREVALSIAAQRGELAIWDRETASEIRVGV